MVFINILLEKIFLGWEKGGRITSFFGEEKILGSYITRLWPIFFALSILVLKKKK